MSDERTGTALAAILDALTLVQGQLDTVTRGNARIEAVQKDILARLDTIDAGQAAVTDLVPVLETILARSIEDRELTRRQMGTVAAIAGFAYAAANAGSTSLPVEVADDPLLERFALFQPANMSSQERALVEWRRVASGASSAELSGLLAAQYEPSPTDTPGTRVLRYQLAAITRAEIEGRGNVPPAPPRTTVAGDASAVARRARSDKLAQLWRAGESAALFAEPELAGALDLFSRAEQRDGSLPIDQLAANLAELHRSLGDRIAEGERPSVGEDRPESGGAQPAPVQVDRQR